MAPSIKDFFKKIDPASAATSSMTSPKKRPVTLDGSEGDFQPEQKLKRSTKSLVKSKAKTTVPIDLTEDQPESPKKKAVSPKKSPVKSAAPSPKKSSIKPASPKKSPAKSPVKVSKDVTPSATPMKKQKSKIVFEDEDEEVYEEEKSAAPVKDESAVAASPSTAAKKFNYREYLMKKSSVPVALGSKEIPEGAPNCLEGLAFLFTGDLSSITRDQASDLVKRYAGRVVSAPSKKTNYVVVGENPGPSKMEKIKALGLSQVDEDGFLDLIRRSNRNQSASMSSSSSPVGEPSSPAKAKKSPVKQAPVKAAKAMKVNSNEGADLWTVKYMPQSHTDLIGNPGIYEKLTDWLSNWSSAENKAALLSGPPGIGKTTMANLACKELGFDSIEMNASDTRSKKTLHETVREIVDATSLSAMFTAGKNVATKKHVLIMDEVDGMSAGDRGGMAELILLIKKTRIPIICICNDRQSIKVRSLANHCLDLRFRRPDARQVLPRIKAIAEKEGLQIQPNAIEELVASTHADIRQILTLLSTYKLTKGTLSYDDSKGLAVENAKDVESGPFEATQNLLGSGQWSRMSMNDKIDQYFIDGSLVPLMIHENYLKCRATNQREIVSKGNMKPNFMDLCAAAADSLSLSDRVDSLIRGSNQEWSLAPLHGVMSSVLPSYYVHGQIGGRIDFASWLGQNSRTGKNQRLLTEITKHTFLHTRAGKMELRLDYIGTLAGSIVGPMNRNGAEGIDKTIEFMDDYSISRDDVDNILDLVLDPARNTAAFAKIPTTVRSAFTRKYNQGVHRLPYSLGGASTSAVKRISTDIGGAEGDPDEDEYAVTPDDDPDADAAGEDDIKKDKMIKAKPVKAAAKKAAPAKKLKK